MIKIKGLDHMDQFDPVIKKLLPTYLNNRLIEIDQLKQLYKNEDLEGIKRIGHKLAGNAGSYGLDELGQMGEKFENLTTLSEFPPLLEGYTKAVHLFKAQLSQD